MLRLALAMSFLGLAALFAVYSVYEMEFTKTYEVDRNKANKDVRIKGTVSAVIEKDKLFLVEVSESKPIIVVVFKGGSSNFTVGSSLEVVGQAREFNGKMEVVAEKVKVK